jgi:hypothetical protein
MFDEVGGLPMHVLVIHVVVMAIPLAMVLAILFAYPRTRAWARLVMPLVAVGALAATFVAKQSGAALQAVRGITPDTAPVGPLIARHSELANQLFYIMIGFAVLAVASAFLVSRPAEDRPTPPSGARKALNVLLPVLLVLVALTAGFWVYRVGDIGARAVWNPDGSQSYQATS